MLLLLKPEDGEVGESEPLVLRAVVRGISAGVLRVALRDPGGERGGAETSLLPLDRGGVGVGVGLGPGLGSLGDLDAGDDAGGGPGSSPQEAWRRTGLFIDELIADNWGHPRSGE